MTKNKNLKEVPAEALRFGVTSFDLSDQKTKGANVPIEMIARSGGEIRHFYWGRAIHDMEGFSTHKKKIPVDYCHQEEIGFLDSFDASDDGLKVSGQLVPTDVASDPLAKMLQRSAGGVPYEASISFTIDRIEAVPAGDKAKVNGQDFTGPVTIFREWSLRGVAVCPYGYDRNTESKFTEQQTEKVEVIEMPKKETELKEPTDLTEEKPVKVPAKKEKPAELTEEKPAKKEKPAELSQDRKDLKKMTEAFGHAAGSRYFQEGCSFADASVLELKKQKEINEELRQKLSAADVAGEDKPLELSKDGEDEKVNLGFAGKLKFK